jgi:ATP-binding cassette subfamily F protein uup
VRQYPGNYSAFLEARQKELREAAPVRTEPLNRPAKEQKVAAAGKRKLSFKEQKELVELETRIQMTEERQAEIESELIANSSDAHLVHELYMERERLARDLARDLDRWSELAELA